MFTGIVEELGRVRRLDAREDGTRLEIEAALVLEDATLGASIAVNGACLTVVELGPGWWAADVVEETLRRTCLGELRQGDVVNLERPVRLSDRLGGHLVQGHVDALGIITGKEPQADGSVAVYVRAEGGVERYVVEKGSVTVDGISLTVAGVQGDTFWVALIPHTQQMTTLGHKGVGARVNLEVDVVAKYVERLLAESGDRLGREARR